MTDAELAAIEARAASATPGPWMPHVWPFKTQSHVSLEKGGQICRLSPRITPGGEFLHNNDCEFIAAARADVPALLEEVRRLRQLLQIIQIGACGNHENCRTCEVLDMLIRRENVC